jgi:PAS domain S-box-containing protein
LPQTGPWQSGTERPGDTSGAWIPRYTEKAEQALKASEQMYRELVENASDLIYAIDLQGNFTAINRAAQRISGYSKAEALKMNIAQLVASDHLEAARQMIQTALRGEPATTYDLDIVTKDGRRVTIEVSHRLLLENGLPRGTHAIARDITERRRLETLERDRARALEMIATRKPLDQILTQLVEMVERQDSRMKAAAFLLRDDRLYVTAAPGLPKGLTTGLDGLRIGPTGCSCGAAAYWGQPVYAADIASDPVWDEHRKLALENKFSSCWSVPILAGNGQVLGTFAVYQQKPCRPSKAQILLLQGASGTAAIAIDWRTKHITTRLQGCRTVCCFRTGCGKRSRRHAVPGPWSHFYTWIWTGSSASTTRLGMPPATSCCGKWPGGCERACARQTAWRG